ncbi:MAG: peptide-methionine (S)-S-oxide reductase MsrA [Candidatus Diapherotrites archaeon]|nr:peptide-methionine (S)-S-oxide reductase MsrA [Candidatus Diapherotrites archaeon]
MGKKQELQTATFGAGCFWGVEEIFRQVPGVKETTVGYTGGKTKNPTYEEVCTDRTGHVEAVRVKFDPGKVSYKKLVEIFFKNHDATTMDRQGPDTGSQYRSAIFYHGEEQKKTAQELKKELVEKHVFRNPIVTQVTPAMEFYEAEDYHQKYYSKRGIKPTCDI